MRDLFRRSNNSRVRLDDERVRVCACASHEGVLVHAIVVIYFSSFCFGNATAIADTRIWIQFLLLMKLMSFVRFA